MPWSLTRKGKAARNFRIKLPCSSSSSFVIFLFIEKVNLLSMEKYQIDSSGKWKPLLIQRADVAQSGLMQNASLRSKGIIASSLAGTGSLPQPHPGGFQRAQVLARAAVLRAQWLFAFLCATLTAKPPCRGEQGVREGGEVKTGRFIHINKSFKSPIQWIRNGWMSREMSLHLYGYGCGAWHRESGNSCC